MEELEVEQRRQALRQDIKKVDDAIQILYKWIVWSNQSLPVDEEQPPVQMSKEEFHRIRQVVESTPLATLDGFQRLGLSGEQLRQNVSAFFLIIPILDDFIEGKQKRGAGFALEAACSSWNKYKAALETLC